MFIDHVLCCVELSLQACLTLQDLWTVASQALMFMGFSRQEYWSGLPSPPSADLADGGVKPASLTSH